MKLFQYLCTWFFIIAVLVCVLLTGGSLNHNLPSWGPFAHWAREIIGMFLNVISVVGLFITLIVGFVQVSSLINKGDFK